MNLPNYITFSRLVIAIVSICLMIRDFWVIGFFLILLAVLLDIVDGRVARAMGHVTKFGIFFDIMVDKIVIISTFFLIGLKIHIAFFYLALLMIIREYTIDTLRAVVATSGKVVSADKFSKIKGVLFMSSMLIIIGGHAFYAENNVFVLIPIILASIAMVFAYITLARFIFKNKI